MPRVVVGVETSATLHEHETPQKGRFRECLRGVNKTLVSQGRSELWRPKTLG
jgi:hypothetical protein